VLGLGNTLSGGIVPAAAVSSFDNTYSLGFDGTNDYVAMDELAYDTGSWVLWVKYTTPISGVILFNAGSDYYLYETGVQVSFNYPGIAAITTISGSVDDGSWHQIAITIDRPDAIGTTTTVKVYVDAVLKNTATGTRSFTNSADVLYFGRYSSSALYYAGNIDEVGWWSGQDGILSGAEITALYNSGEPVDLKTDSGDYTSSDNLTSYWKMGDGDTYPTITDNKGENDGTMTNMASGDIESDIPS